MLEQIVSEEKKYCDQPKTVGSGDRRIRVLSDSAVRNAIAEIIEDKMNADTAATLGLEYEAKTPGVVGVDRGSELLDRIIITKNAFDVGVGYAKKMCDGEALELGMHMLHQVDAPLGLVTDLVPAYCQTVSPGTCHFKNYTSFDYPGDRVYAGWCHSHANMNVFHSGDDNENVLRKLDREELEIPGTFINYLPSLVINTRGECYGAMGVRWDVDGAQKKVVDDIRVKFVDEDIDTIKFDFDRFREENIRGGFGNGFYRSRERTRESKEQQSGFRADKPEYEHATSEFRKYH